MLNSRTLMTYLLTLLVGFMMTACPDDDCSEDGAGSEEETAAGSEEEGESDDSCEEGGDIGGDSNGIAGEAGSDGGSDGGEAGSSGGDDMPATAYNHVVVQDNTTDINTDGTPGVDICEVDVTCDGTSVDDASVVSSLGSPVCNGSNDDNCVCDGAVVGVCTSGKNRADESLIFDGDSSCEDDNWASTGINGFFALEIDGLSECESVAVTVTERVGEQTESYVVALCDDVANFSFSEMMFGDSCMVIGSAGDGGMSSFSWPSSAK